MGWGMDGRAMIRNVGGEQLALLLVYSLGAYCCFGCIGRRLQRRLCSFSRLVQ